MGTNNYRHSFRKIRLFNQKNQNTLNSEVPKLSEFYSFLENRCLFLEALDQSNKKNKTIKNDKIKYTTKKHFASHIATN